VRTRMLRYTLAAWPVVILLTVLNACAPVAIKTRNGIRHPVQRGETLWGICTTYGVNMTSVCMYNGIRDPQNIRAGERLFIPGAKRVVRVAPGAGEGTAAPAPPEFSQGGPAPRGLRFLWPVASGRVTSGFGPRNGGRHDGIDIAAPRGTPVRAAESGKIVYSGNGIRGYGNLIIVQHRNQYSTVYAHNHRNLVSVDARVERGQRIATVGSTGRSSGNHLHFEIRRKVKPVDPMKYLRKPDG